MGQDRVYYTYIYIPATPGVCPGVTSTIRASTIINYHGINYHHFRVKVRICIYIYISVCVCDKTNPPKKKKTSYFPCLKLVTIQLLSVHISPLASQPSAWLKPFDGSIFLGWARNIVSHHGWLWTYHDISGWFMGFAMCLQHTYQLFIIFVVIHNIFTKKTVPKCNNSNSSVKDVSTEGRGHSLHKDLAVPIGITKLHMKWWPMYHVIPACLYQMAQEVRSNAPKSSQILVFSGVLMSSTLWGCGKYSAFHSLSEPSKPTSRIRFWRRSWVLTVCFLIQLVQPRIDLGKSWINS